MPKGVFSRLFRKAAVFALAPNAQCTVAPTAPSGGVPAVPRAVAPPQAASPDLDLTAYRGKVVYLDFWASWCAPCKQSFGYMNLLRQFYSPEDLVILTVSLDHKWTAAVDFLNAAGAQLPVIHDPRGGLADRFKVTSMPTSILFDRDGRQRFVQHGYFDSKACEYAENVALLVGELR